MSETTLKVFRFDPTTDAEPHYDTYTVPNEEHGTVLQAIHYVNDNIEPIGFDYSCRGGLCGRCACSVDGTPGLACYTLLEHNATVTVEPLPGFPVIKDLLVDRGTVTRKIDEADLTVSTVASLEREDLPALDYELYWETLERAQMCRECGSCYSVCPVYGADSAGYAGPAAFSQMAIRHLDGLDQRDRVWQAVMGGVFRCMLCDKCSEVCPAGIKHVDLHQMFRDEAKARGIVPQDAVSA
ncbi:succinate dehydrogenase/fumarate reductase iron-sulfur subunit [uncultured Adlercreutzia sp.]|uniref:succinate dehydrogenase/fumarate reductase iron-sulfur subunit n=1 Tax=uncultured Adlercreutzia sp. TaxID=875803 RepID=UPI0026F39B82|nr:2Fe-2S iron-sulfur cluster-binding protein [uncultured Adlercreutzia sp.]